MAITSRTRNAVYPRGTVGSNPTVSANENRMGIAHPVFIIGTRRDSNPKGRAREAKKSSGLLSRARFKPTERGGAERRMRSIRVNPTVSIRVVFVDGELDFDGCYITTAHILGFVLQNMAIWVVFVDGGLDFDGCYITSVHILGFVLQIMAIWGVFVDGGLDFDGCYITNGIIGLIDE